MRRLHACVAAALFAALAGGCEDSSTRIEDPSLAPTAFDWGLPPHIPAPAEPANNPTTREKVELGRFLFHDRRLSGNGTQSCSSCHLQEKAFSDGKVRAQGSTGMTLARNSQALVNVAYNATYTWANPALTLLEQQMLVPLFGERPVEMGITDSNRDAVVARLAADGRYRRLFAAAFPGEEDPVNLDNVVDAIAAFQRTLLSFDAPYDRWQAGDEQALSAPAKRGMALFFGERLECFHCHGGFNFTLSSRHGATTFVEKPFHNTGLYNVGGTGAYPADSPGIIDITRDPDDAGRFRAPTLRNIGYTAPYMHDGSMATLGEVVDFYAAGGRNISSGPDAGDGRLNPHKSQFIRGFTLTEQEKADLIAFLHSLDDPGFIRNPAFSDPFADGGTP